MAQHFNIYTAPRFPMTAQNKAVGFDQRPRPLHDRYTRTDTCVRWEMSVKSIAVKFLSVTLLKPPFGGFRSETVTWIQK
jgi:hypothetical protein